MDAARAALGAAFGHETVRLSDCTRWPERRGCGQGCLRQIESTPEGCLVRRIVARWYDGKLCAICRRRIEGAVAIGLKPGLLGPDGVTREWVEVAPEELPATLATHRPVCARCNCAESFRRRHPELVTDRPPH